MFRDDRQIAIVNAILCDRLGALRGRWSPAGCDIAPDQLGPCSSGERVVWELTWALWNGHKPRGSRGLTGLLVLDAHHLRLVGELLAALADGRAEAVDGWIEKHGSEAEVLS